MADRLNVADARCDHAIDFCIGRCAVAEGVTRRQPVLLFIVDLSGRWIESVEVNPVVEVLIDAEGLVDGEEAEIFIRAAQGEIERVGQRPVGVDHSGCVPARQGKRLAPGVEEIGAVGEIEVVIPSGCSAAAGARSFAGLEELGLAFAQGDLRQGGLGDVILQVMDLGKVGAEADFLFRPVFAPGGIGAQFPGQTGVEAGAEVFIITVVADEIAAGAEAGGWAELLAVPDGEVPAPVGVAGGEVFAGE